MSKRVRGVCRGCGRAVLLHTRGLCSACYQKPDVRATKAAPPRPPGAPPRPGNDYCVGCGRLRLITRKCRGLCNTCHADPDVRASVPDRRFAAVGRTAAERNAILTDPDVCPPAAVEGAARQVCIECRRPDLLDDLIQVGWLVLIRAAGTWEGRNGCQFITHSWLGLIGLMRRYARGERRVTPIGIAGTDFDCPDRPSPEAA